MKILVISDSHGAYGSFIQAVEENKNADLVLFLGDGGDDFKAVSKAYPELAMKAVQGNCDYSFAPDFETLTIKNYTIFMTHGHLFGVKSNLKRLKQQGRQRKADIVLFGHTHQAEITWEDSTVYFNPGSLMSYRRGSGSYGTITLTDDEILPEIHWL